MNYEIPHSLPKSIENFGNLVGLSRFKFNEFLNVQIKTHGGNVRTIAGLLFLFSPVYKKQVLNHVDFKTVDFRNNDEVTRNGIRMVLRLMIGVVVVDENQMIEFEMACRELGMAFDSKKRGTEYDCSIVIQRETLTKNRKQLYNSDIPYDFKIVASGRTIHGHIVVLFESCQLIRAHVQTSDSLYATTFYLDDDDEECLPVEVVNKVMELLYNHSIDLEKDKRFDLCVGKFDIVGIKGSERDDMNPRVLLNRLKLTTHEDKNKDKSQENTEPEAQGFEGDEMNTQERENDDRPRQYIAPPNQMVVKYLFGEPGPRPKVVYKSADNVTLIAHLVRNEYAFVPYCNHGGRFKSNGCTGNRKYFICTHCPYSMVCNLVEIRKLDKSIERYEVECHVTEHSNQNYSALHKQHLGLNDNSGKLVANHKERDKYIFLQILSTEDAILELARQILADKLGTAEANKIFNLNAPIMPDATAEYNPIMNNINPILKTQRRNNNNVGRSKKLVATLRKRGHPLRCRKNEKDDEEKSYLCINN